jgi:hypothetical protein
MVEHLPQSRGLEFNPLYCPPRYIYIYIYIYTHTHTHMLYRLGLGKNKGRVVRERSSVQSEFLEVENSK